MSETLKMLGDMWGKRMADELKASRQFIELFPTPKRPRLTRKQRYVLKIKETKRRVYDALRVLREGCYLEDEDY